jgi:hypothetical protein
VPLRIIPLVQQAAFGAQAPEDRERT